MPSLPKLQIPSIPNPRLRLGSRSATDIVGLDIQPGLVAAVQARVNGTVLAQRAAALPLAGDAVREGEVIDQEVLADTLRELFDTSGLGKRVRIGVANQRTVMRMLELPPVTDRKELTAAVRFQAQDQVPMPLADAVLDFHPLGIVETPAGPRQRVLLVAAQRDMVQRLLAVAEAAGLKPEGIDLSAFALIRSLHRSVPQGEDSEQTDRVLYLNVDGLTNLAIAEGTVCRFTRVVGGGLEGLASELAERRGIALDDARALITAIDLTARPDDAHLKLPQQPTPDAPGTGETAPAGEQEPPDASDVDGGSPAGGEAVAAAEAFAVTSMPSEEPTPISHEQGEAHETPIDDPEVHFEGALAAAPEEGSDEPAQAPEQPSDADVRVVLENGIREISGQVRTSLEFHRSQDGGGEVSHVVLSGSALDVTGFPEALQASLGLEVRAEAIGLSDPSLGAKVSTHRLAVAAGLATSEAPQ